MLLHHDLPSGDRVRLRLPRRADLRDLTALAGEREAARLLRFDPREHAVVCAATFTGDGEAVIGVGAIALRRGTVPDVLLVADGHDGDVAALLERALVARAQTAHRPGVRSRRSSAARGVRALRGVGRRTRHRLP